MIFFERGDNLIAFFLGFSITLNIMFVVVLFVVLRFKKKANKLLDFNTDEVEDINSLYDFFKQKVGDFLKKFLLVIVSLFLFSSVKAYST